MAKKSTAIDVTQGVIWQQLLSLCVPIFFSSFFQQAYTLIGTYIVGQFGGKLALGGIQATMVLTELCIGFCVGVGAGLGAKTIAGCDRAVRIPMAHGVDSLNVAAASAVAFWQLCPHVSNEYHYQPGLYH